MMWRTRRARSTLLVGAMVIVLLAACTQSDPGIPTANGDGTRAQDEVALPTSPSDPAEAAWAYARCIRENGFPEWPDPQPDGTIMITRGGAMTMDDPRRQAAMEACQHLRPPGAGGMGLGAGGGAAAMDEETMLEFARCMRENGVPEFPDPTAGGGPMIFGADSGINPNDPTFQVAAQHCVSTVLGEEGP